ncbi:hypothetical protein [Runella slithyformis]|uniref:Uncharacterized protein n=1 Tax=Runella slithyformis (strain ATCC 29530 / DSM 19594 / LMG 11500 / NCIMB 11436 / LSU 4) TaxID=761193 RepID=A0A7U3ZNC7_RUNSL|nr:hypothetical protein [Runella slithyformis]AEI50385.1 hypothetical protein Runsl_4032 [Runella slithyformis DSM 19594]
MTYNKCKKEMVFSDESTVDVRFEENTVSFVRQKIWTVQELEEQVARFEYSGENLPKDPEVEKAKLPPFALAFYKYIFFKNRLPDETELWDHYIHQPFVTFDEEYIEIHRRGAIKAFLITSVKARMLRSYPSLVRDFHFYVLCLTSGVFERVSYSLQKDYFEGVDLCVTYAGRAFQVSILLNSPRARTYKCQKYSRHEEVPANEVIMLFDLTRNAQVNGKIKLFSEKHVQELVEELKKRIAN